MCNYLVIRASGDMKNLEFLTGKISMSVSLSLTSTPEPFVR